MQTNTNLTGGEPLTGGSGLPIAGGGATTAGGGTAASGGNATTSSAPPSISPATTTANVTVASQINVDNFANVVAGTTANATAAQAAATKNAAEALSAASATQTAVKVDAANQSETALIAGSAAIMAASTSPMVSLSDSTSIINYGPSPSANVASVAASIVKTAGGSASALNTVLFSVEKWDTNGSRVTSDLTNSATFDFMRVTINMSGVSSLGFIHTASNGKKTIISQPVKFKTMPSLGTRINFKYGAYLEVLDVIGTLINCQMYVPFSGLGKLSHSTPANTILDVSGLVAAGAIDKFGFDPKYIDKVDRVIELSAIDIFTALQAGGKPQDGKLTDLANTDPLEDKSYSGKGTAGDIKPVVSTLSPAKAETQNKKAAVMVAATPVYPGDPTKTLTTATILKALPPSVSLVNAKSSRTIVEPDGNSITVVSVHFTDPSGNYHESSMSQPSTWPPQGVEITIPYPSTGSFKLTHISDQNVITELGTIPMPAVQTYSLAYGTSFAISSVSSTKITGTYFGPFSDVVVSPITPTIPCLVAGTRVATPSGYLPVEQLRTGDTIVTAAGDVVPIKMFQRTIPITTTDTAPYVIKRSAFGSAGPKAAITLSPMHAIQVRKGLWEIPKYAAERYPGVRQKAVGETVAYYHVETPDYFRDNLLIEGGIIVESFAGPRIVEHMPVGAKVYQYSAKLGGFTRFTPTKTLKTLKTLKNLK
jgi:hypothetical protein